MLKSDLDISRVIGYQTASYLTDQYGQGILSDIYSAVEGEFVQTVTIPRPIDHIEARAWLCSRGLNAIICTPDGEPIYDPSVPRTFFTSTEFLKQYPDSKVFDPHGNFLMYVNGTFVEFRFYGRSYLAPNARFRVANKLSLYPDLEFHEAFTKIIEYLKTFYQKVG